jgi:tRNA(Ile)-lysidine synthase
MPVTLVVGLSGGLDSTVLLHLLNRVHQKLNHVFNLQAVHVHHGLQPAADDFARQAQSLCALLNVPLQVVKVSITQQAIADLGIEAAARQYRYQALAQSMPAQSVLVLAHHRDDLLETALLQWIRGAGIEGLSAMKQFSPMTVSLGGNDQPVAYKTITRWRPLLNYSRAGLLDYATREGLTWIEDPTNEQTDLARNRIRHEVMPVLRSLRSGADTAMARSIAHMQTARDLLDLITDQALQGCQVAPGAAGAAGAVGTVGTAELSLPALLAQDQALSARVLRAWLANQGAPTPPARRLAEFLRQLRQAKEPFGQMDLTDPQTGMVWRVCRVRDRLRIAR